MRIHGDRDGNIRTLLRPLSTLFLQKGERKELCLDLYYPIQHTDLDSTGGCTNSTVLSGMLGAANVHSPNIEFSLLSLTNG